MSDRTPDTRILLGSSVDLSNLTALRLELDSVLRIDGGVVIDSRHVVRADTAALQLLLGFVRQARRQGREVRWEHVSTSLTESARLLGLSEPLGLNALDLPGASRVARS